MSNTADLKKYNYITNESISPVRAIITLAWPVLVEQILSTLVNYADTAMVGSLGAYATAAVSISNPIFMLINGISLSLGIGITTFIARSVGARDVSRAKSLIHLAVRIIFFIGIPLSLIIGLLSRHIPLWMGAAEDVLENAVQYNIITSIGRPFAIGLILCGSVFRGYSDTKTPMLANLGMNVINITGNYLLIYPTHGVTIFNTLLTIPGAGWGVSGAAAATSISQAFAFITLFIILYRRPGPFKINFHENYRIDKNLIRPVLTVSLPAMLERICMSGAQIIVIAAIASLGTVVLAANTLYLTAESLSFMPGAAFMTAITTIVSQCLGAKKPKLAKRYIHLTMALSALLLSCIAAGLYIFARSILSFFTPDEEVINIAQECLRIVAFLQPIQVQAWVISGALRGAGDIKVPFYITVTCTWLIRVLGAFTVIRLLGYGLREAVICMFIDSTVRSILLFIRLKSGKWERAVISGKA